MLREKWKNIPIQTKAAVIFTICTFICKGINFITIPIFTRLLSAEQMGIVTTYNSWQVLLVVFANLSLDSGSFNIAMMEYKNDRYGYVSSILILSTFSTIIISVVYYSFKPWFSNVLGLDSNLMILMLTGFVFMPATSFWMLHQRYEYRYKSTALVTLCSTFVSVVSSVCLTYYCGKKGMDNLAFIRLISSNGSLILFGVFFYLLILHRGKKGFSQKYWSFVFRVNTPLLVHGLAKNVLDVSDRIMISKIVGKREVGVYGVLYSLSAIALIVWTAINSTLIPYMFECLEKKENERINKVVEPMLMIYSVACICMTLISPELVSILGREEYAEAVYLMPAITSGIFFTSLYNIYSNILLYYKKTNYIMYATIVAAVFNIVMNYIFINLCGYQAAAYTTLLSYVLLAVMQFLMLKKNKDNKILMHDGKLWIISAVTVVICVLINALYKVFVLRYIVMVIFLFFCINYRKMLKRL